MNIPGMSAPIDPRVELGKVFKPNPTWRAKWLRLDESVHPEVSALALAAECFGKRAVVNDPGGPRLLVVGGVCGTGKSHIARALVRYFNAVAITAWQRGAWRADEVPRADFAEWPALAESEPGVRVGAWESATTTDFLALDDVGAESDRFKSGLPVSNLARLLNSRERRWTCITTNYPPATWETRFDKRVMDRLHRRAEIVEIKTAPSFWQSSPAITPAPPGG